MWGGLGLTQPQGSLQPDTGDAVKPRTSTGPGTEQVPQSDSLRMAKLRAYVGSCQPLRSRLHSQPSPYSGPPSSVGALMISALFQFNLVCCGAPTMCDRAQLDCRRQDPLSALA